MAATPLPATGDLVVPGTNADAAAGYMTLTAMVAGGEGNSFVNGGTELLAINNSGATIRNVSFLDKDGNTVVTYTHDASKFGLYGPFDTSRFGNLVTVIGAHAELLAAVVKLDRIPQTLTGA